MADPVANVVVSMPSQLFTRPDRFASVANGKIYVGNIDTDPTVTGNQIQVYIQAEDGSLTAVSQPIRTNQAGFPVYNGEVVKYVTQQGHSMAVLSSSNVQLFYFPNVLGYDPDQFGPDFVDKLAQTGVYANDNTKGDAMVGVVQPYSGAARRTQHEKNAEFVTLKDAGAAGDGLTNDTASFAKFETWFTEKYVDLRGNTYFVDSIPVGNKYYNGKFLLGTTLYPALYQPTKQWSEIFCVGDGAISNFKLTDSSSQSLIVMGTNAGAAATPPASGGIIIGDGAHEFSPYIPYQTLVIGKGSFARAAPNDSTLANVNGNRNVGLGAYTGLFTTTGYQNVFVGRNTGSGITTGAQNSGFGTGAISGSAPVGIEGKVVNEVNFTMTRAVGIGYNAGKNNFNGNNSVFVGDRAGVNVKSGSLNVFVGSLNSFGLGSNVGLKGNLLTLNSAIGGTYSQSGNVVTVTTSSAHTAVVGSYIIIGFSSGLIAQTTSDSFGVTAATVPSSTVFTFVSPVSQTTSGACTISSVCGLTAGTDNSHNTIVGYSAMSSALTAEGMTVLGYQAGSNLTAGNRSTLIGRMAGNPILGGDPNTSFGNNCVAIGDVSPLSGDNQVQLGNSATTVYYYQLAQRSDERDKADIKPTSLGLNLIREIEWIDYKWNLREDYYEYQEEEVIRYTDETVDYHTGEYDSFNNPIMATKIQRVEHSEKVAKQVKKDIPAGSMTRNRWHHGVSAQQLGNALEKLGVDSGIYQDSTINGGADVKSASYIELIAPIGRAVQEVDAELANVRKELSEALQMIKKLESK